LKNPDDLADVQESAIEAIFSLNLGSYEIDQVSDDFERRILQVLARSRPDIEYAYQGLPVTLTPGDIDEMNMGKEIGILFALGLAHALPDGRIGLRLRLMLFLADQLLKRKEAESAAESLRLSIHAIGDNEQ
jgi:hypothetical protein